MKKIISLASALCACATAFAGGLNTNTNQNASYLRQMSQGAIIDITGLYVNPAGTAYLTPGSHLSLNVQSAKQSRTIDTTFPLFQLNANDHNATHNFEGEAFAPVIPSFQYSYNWEKWSVNASFALVGGGGKCEFDKGLGSFEALYAGQLYQLVPATVNAQLPGMVQQAMMGQGLDAPTAAYLAGTGTYNSQLAGYSLNAYMKGKQYFFGFTLGATYKVLDNLAVSAGLRGIYAMCNYNGYVQDIKAQYGYTYDIPAIPGMFPGLQGNGTGETSLDDKSLTLNADQTGMGFAPIIGVDWKINDQWNIAAKYEFKTRLRLENSTEMNAFAAETAKTNATLGQFADGTKIAADQASLLTVGAQYSPIKNLRFMAGYNLYGDKNATQFNNKQDLIDDNTFEINAGVEYDICKYLTASASWQTTQYGLSDAYMNDLSFNVSSNNLGLGVRVAVTKHCDVDFGYMKTFYQEREVTTQTAAGNKVDVYNRTNRLVGVGVNLKF